MRFRIAPLLWYSFMLHLLAAAILVQCGFLPLSPLRVIHSPTESAGALMIELRELNLPDHLAVIDGAIQTGGTGGGPPSGVAQRQNGHRLRSYRSSASSEDGGAAGDRTRPRPTYGVRHKHSRASATTSNPALHQILRQIARARHYPQAARRQQLEGRPVVQFRITRNGQIASATVIKTSGHALLDTAAIDTIHRAAPLPYYAETIRLPIRFELR